MSDENQQGLPTGRQHLAWIIKAGYTMQYESVKLLKEYKPECDAIGVSLNALYQVGTCYRGCRDSGGHVLERLCGRAYNLGCAAFHLLMVGLYDEALGLVRSLGELTNLIGLSATDRKAFQEWLDSDRKTRMTKFGPAKVRIMLERVNSPFVYATKAWYGELSESYIHISPQTQPNAHSGLRIVGGIYQTDGAVKAIKELADVLWCVATMVSKFAKFDDLFEELVAVNKDRAESD
jgi:hypothetical protein